ncbi:MAG: hypothetical protein ACM3XO_09680 [Bacteroidota bacterium]
MFDDYGKQLLKSGIIDAKSGNRESARRYLDRAVYISNDHDVLAEAWFWMSELVDNPAEKRKALENCLAHDLQHARARRSLAILEGKLKPDEIIDPDQLPSAPKALHSANAERFMCPKCGGRMSFAPDGASLVCEYCTRNQKFIAQPGTAEEKDFLIAMATARGHGRPLEQQVFHCEGCGCEFILPPEQISYTCVYCGSPQVVHWDPDEQILAPDGIIPHAFDQQHALNILKGWLLENEVKPEAQFDPPRGVYLPLWTFDLGGEIGYTGEVYEEEEIFGKRSRLREPKRVSDSYPVQVNDLPIPASRKLSAVFLKLIPTFELRGIRPYDPRYLASWPAEVYDIPMAEASLDARAQGLSRYKRELPARLDPIKLISTSSAKMTVDSFRFNLLPVWITEVFFHAKLHLVLINGQNGAIESDLNGRKLDAKDWKEWLGELLG